MAILEVCVTSVQAAVAAEKLGADRIELCTQLRCGGVTPSAEMIQAVCELVTIPVQLLVRPRAGDFVYCESELSDMGAAIRSAKQIGVSGIVSGALLADGSIDVEITTRLVSLSRPLSFTFHKAFDEVPEQLPALKQLEECGVDQILTSGGAATALTGIDRLKMLVEASGNSLSIMPGGGLRPENIREIAQHCGATEIHCSGMIDNDSSDLSIDRIQKMRQMLNEF